MPATCSICRRPCTTLGRPTTTRRTSICIKRRLSPLDVEAARHEAISYAAYQLIKHRFVFGFPGSTGPGGPGAFDTLVDIT